MTRIPDDARAEMRADYHRQGIELTDEAIDEMAWHQACEDAAGEAPDDEGWQDDYRAALGPGPGWDDTPDTNRRASQ